MVLKTNEEMMINRKELIQEDRKVNKEQLRNEEVLLDEIHEFVLNFFEIYHLIKTDIKFVKRKNTYRKRFVDLGKIHPRKKQIFYFKIFFLTG